MVAAIDVNRGTRPLLKWAGGKRELLPSILPIVPKTFGAYFEPFLGGGAVFFAIQPQPAYLSDANVELIDCYIAVRDHAEELITLLSQWSNTENTYYEVRAAIPSDPIEKAARLIYLTRLSFNGIHRLNLRGEFNVPYGHKSHVAPCDADAIRSASRALASAVLAGGDFERAVHSATEGDLIYLDPPYTVAHGNNGFLKYNARIFSWEDQERLASVARGLILRGCHVIVSNADHPSIRSLYPDFQVRTIERFSRMAASAAHRRVVTECIFFHKGGIDNAD